MAPSDSIRAAGLIGRGWIRILAVDRFVRLHLAFFTATWVLLGAASVPRGTSAAELGALLAVALCFHVYAYVLNDVVDLDIDRTQPARRQDPLVRGVITRRQALSIALIQPLLTIPITASLDGGSTAQVALAAGFALMGAYNLWGKRCPFPPATDAIQGLAWGSLALYASYALGAAPTPLTWIVVAYATIFTVFINGIHGSFRDLANDLANRARTTAIFLGARPGPADSRRHVPAGLAAYAWCVLAILIGINGALIVRNDFHYGAVVWIVTAGAVAGLNLCAVLLQPTVLRPSGSGSDIAWRLQMYMLLTALPISFLAHASVGILVALALLNAFALVLFDCTSAVTRWALIVMGSTARARAAAQRLAGASTD